MSTDKKLSADQSKEFIKILEERFTKNKRRHPDLKWEQIRSRLDDNPEKLWSLYEMERTGGEPDLLWYKKDEYVFCDFSKESPQGRRSLCYDLEAWNSRKKFKPGNNALDTAASMGVEILDEAQYKALQKLGEFDTKTSSWIKTPDSIRNLGGAIFGDFRFGRVFIYHNGAESYYASRGFRALLKVF